jgi:hypothetical protein
MALEYAMYNIRVMPLLPEWYPSDTPPLRLRTRPWRDPWLEKYLCTGWERSANGDRVLASHYE